MPKKLNKVTKAFLRLVLPPLKVGNADDGKAPLSHGTAEETNDVMARKDLSLPSISDG